MEDVGRERGYLEAALVRSSCSLLCIYAVGRARVGRERRYLEAARLSSSYGFPWHLYSKAWTL